MTKRNIKLFIKTYPYKNADDYIFETRTESYLSNKNVFLEIQVQASDHIIFAKIINTEKYYFPISKYVVDRFVYYNTPFNFKSSI